MCSGYAMLFLYLEQFEFVRFLGAGGVSGAIFSSIFFSQQLFTKIHYRISLYTAFVPSFIVGFVLQKYWAFRSLNDDVLLLQLWLYSLKRFGFIGANDALLYLFVEVLGCRTIVAQIGIALLGAGFSYFILKAIFSL